VETGFWHQRWAEGRIGFHRDEPHPALERHWPTLAGGSGAARVLVPLCGKSSDLLWLRDRGHDVLGVELVRQAIVDFGRENDVALHERLRSGHPVFESERLALWEADFFELGPPELGSIDAVFDRAALVAVEPARRGQYVQRLTQLVAPGGTVLLVALTHDLSGGPPFSLEPAELPGLFAQGFSGHCLGRTDVLAEEPHFAQRGASRLFEEIWRFDRHL
jgi:thiopurine S-methyltransferase